MAEGPVPTPEGVGTNGSCECFILRSRTWKPGAVELGRLLSPQLVRRIAEILLGYSV